MSNITYKMLLYYLFILQPAAKCEMPISKYFKYELQYHRFSAREETFCCYS